MYSRIVVPLDGSDFSDAAIPLAASIARRAGAEIELVHVHRHEVDDPYLGGITPFLFEGETRRELAHERLLVGKEREWLKARAARILSDWNIPTTHRLLDGNVAHALEREVERLSPDLVVMSTHARQGISRWRHGSVGDALVRHTNRPILLVRPNRDGGLMRGPNVKNILVPLDGSAFSEQVLEPVETLARLLRARVTLFHAMVPIAGMGGPYGPTPVDEEEREATHIADYLESIAERLTGLADRPVVHYATRRPPWAAIVDLMHKGSFDLVAMATHGRGGAMRMLLGSTANEVVSRIHLPVFLVRPQATVSPEIPAEMAETAV